MKLLIQPGDGIDRLVKGIKKAKKSVEIVIFRFDRPDIEEALVDAVESDKDQGESHKGSVKFPYRDEKVCVKGSIFVTRCPRAVYDIMRP